MATTNAEIPVTERDLMRERMTLIVTIGRPVHHWALLRLGFAVIKLGAWIAGFAGTRAEVAE